MPARWNALAPWARAAYMIGGPRIASEALELGIITKEGAEWLAQWFEKRPGTSIFVCPQDAPGALPTLLELDETARVIGSGPLDSFGFAEPEPEPEAPSGVLAIELHLSEGRFFATDNEHVGEGATPGEALATLGKKLDAQLARDAWKGREG